MIKNGLSPFFLCETLDAIQVELKISSKMKHAINQFDQSILRGGLNALCIFFQTFKSLSKFQIPPKNHV